MLSRGNGKSQGALHGVERIAFQNGERLFDVSRTGAERPWRKKKISSRSEERRVGKECRL